MGDIAATYPQEARHLWFFYNIQLEDVYIVKTDLGRTRRGISEFSRSGVTRLWNYKQNEHVPKILR